LTSSPGNAAAARGGAPALPRVAIIGRPNVGKSTLFNALLGRRRTITHSDPGVTRDPVEASCSIAGARVSLVDTGGYTADDGGLDGVVSARSLKAARESDLVLLVLDALETTQLDREFMRLLRPLSDKLLLVVNKVDTPDRDSLVWNAHAHGFPHVIGVSAAHHRSMDHLRETIVAILEAQREEPLAADSARRRSAPASPDEETVRVAILGKPNTGKSTLANRLLGEERSIVSSVPGTTRDVVEGSFVHKGRTFLLLDTAGIRRKSRVTDPVEYYSVNRAIESIARADIVFLTVDATQGLVDQDKKIAAQAVKEGRGVLIVLSKWDLMKDSPSLLEEAGDMVRFHFPVLGFAPVLPVSAHTGYGVRKLIDTAASVWDQLQRRVSTGRLNQSLESWVAHYKLPVRGKNYKIRFMTQVGVNPVRFVAFVNRMSGFPTSYGQYLENCIRRDFDLAQVPVMLEFRQSAKSVR
jgi:GTP-binding protein